MPARSPGPPPPWSWGDRTFRKARACLLHCSHKYLHSTDTPRLFFTCICLFVSPVHPNRAWVPTAGLYKTRSGEDLFFKVVFFF